MYKPEISKIALQDYVDARFAPASSTDADVTAGDTLNNADNATIDYDKIAADAADIHNSSLAAFDRIVNSLKVLDSNRTWFTERIVSPSGYIAIPAHVDNATRIKLLKLGSEYFDAASEAENYLFKAAKILQGTMANSAALALIAEVHRLTHQEGEVGDLLRDLQSKGHLEAIVNLDNNAHPFWLTGSSGIGFGIDEEKEALVDQATAELHEAMKPYQGATAALTLARFFKKETDESGRLLYRCYFFNTSEFRPIREVEISNNMYLFASALLVSFDNTVSKCQQAEKNLLETIKALPAANKNAQEDAQE